MRDYTWQMFEVTGDVEAYLLYRACDMQEAETNEDVNAVGATDSRDDGDEPLK